MKELDLIEATHILEMFWITDSFQMTARWLREGRIKGSRSENRKEGWRIEENDLYDFIDSIRPGLIDVFKKMKSEQVGMVEGKYETPLKQAALHYPREEKKEDESVKDLKNIIVDLDRSFNQFKKETLEQIASLQSNIDKNSKSPKSEGTTEGDNSKIDNSSKPKPVKAWSKEKITVLVSNSIKEGTIPGDIESKKIDELYSRLFTNEGYLHERLLTKDGESFNCPITGNVRSLTKFPSALKKAIKHEFSTPKPEGKENDKPTPKNEHAGNQENNKLASGKDAPSPNPSNPSE